eukprot:scaffold156745_cov32-Tisochrysis_lutea.AAC.6
MTAEPAANACATACACSVGPTRAQTGPIRVVKPLKAPRNTARERSESSSDVANPKQRLPIVTEVMLATMA